MSFEQLYAVRNVLSDKYAFYLRKSRADLEMEALGEGETLAKHLKILETLAAKHDIHPDQIVVYRELVSGESIQERPEMMKLLDHVHQKRYKAVFVVEVERLARGNTKDQGEVAEAFQASHTKIITPMKTYDPDNEFDEEYFEFGLFMSRREYKTIRRRLENGKQLSVQEGNYLLPQRVFGYDIIRPSKKDRTLKIREDETKIVQMIFDWYTEDRKPIGWITRQLTAMGVQTIKKKPQWNRSTVFGMLSNPIYVGKVTWGGSKTVKEYDQASNRLKKVRKFDQEPEIYEGKHDGIISLEQFEKAQMLLEKSSDASLPIGTEMVNPLAGMLVCCDCGRHFVANQFNDGREPRLLHARQTKCKKKSMPIRLVMEAFGTALSETIEYFEVQSQDGDDKSVERYEMMLEAMEADLAKKERQRSRLFQDYEDEVYTRDEFIERKQIYNQAIEDLKEQIAEAKKAAPEPVNFSERIHSLNSMIACINDPDLSAKAKNDYLKLFIDRISYDVVDFGHKKGGKPIIEVHFK